MTKVLLFSLLFLLSCNKKVDNFPEELNKFIYSNREIDSELWSVKVLNSELVEKSENIPENKRCETLNVVYSVVLKRDCYEQKDLWDENVVISQIKKAITKEEKAFKMGNCFTEQDVDKNLAKWKEDQMKAVGEKVCVSYANIIFGGGCEKEVVITKEMVEEDYAEVKARAESSLTRQTTHKKGEQFLESSKVKVCRSEEGPREFSVIP